MESSRYWYSMGLDFIWRIMLKLIEKSKINNVRWRVDSKFEAERLLGLGENEKANKKFIEAVEITPHHAHCLIQTLKRLNIDYYVAPYEADAQLAFLCKEGYADFVITEDSDLLAFGVPRCLFKFNFDQTGIEINMANLTKCSDMSFDGFDGDLFLTTCILAGCDYLESIKGIGFIRAHKYVTKACGDLDIIMKQMVIDGKSVPKDFLRWFNKAFLTFHF